MRVSRWHGGKWILAPWIISHFPPHRVYVEPVGGAASVLLRKPRSYAEVYNDLDGDVVNLFRVLRDAASAARLIELLRLTPFARQEFEMAYAPTKDQIERAYKLVVRSFMGFGSSEHVGAGGGRLVTGFRSNSNRPGTTPAHEWMSFPAHLQAIIERLQGVVIECRDAMEVCRAHDGPETLHYVDPPYLPETRSRGKLSCTKHRYNHELDKADHGRLLHGLKALSGAVVISGYPSPLYDDTLLPQWVRVERAALADGARPRREVLWVNPKAVRDGERSLFGG